MAKSIVLHFAVSAQNEFLQFPIYLTSPRAVVSPALLLIVLELPSHFRGVFCG